MSRRDLLKGTGAGLGAAGLGAAGLGALLSACGNAAGSVPTITSLPLPRKNRPVRWPIFSDNRAIPSGLKPETGATLKLYNWTAYMNQTCINNFAKKYKCSVEWTSFNTMADAIAKIKSGEADYDVFVPTPDNLGQLVEAKLIQPLNHSYIPNIEQCWPDYKNPFYDVGWQYTVPYTVYTTGIAWRKDHIDDNPARWKNGYQFPWQKKYAGKLAILDDYREGLSLGLIYNGNYDLNTTSGTQRGFLEGLGSRTSTRSSAACRSTTTTTRTSRAGRSGSTTPGRATSPLRPGSCRRACRSRSSATGSRKAASDRSPTTRWSSFRRRSRRSSRTCSSTTSRTPPTPSRTSATTATSSR